MLKVMLLASQSPSGSSGPEPSVSCDRTLRHLRYVLALAQHLGGRDVLDALRRTELERLRGVAGADPVNLDAAGLEQLRAAVAELPNPGARGALELELELVPLFAWIVDRPGRPI